jgi:hypothetical protein
VRRQFLLLLFRELRLGFFAISVAFKTSPPLLNTKVVNFDNGCDISDEDVSIRDDEKCCVCGDFEPKALRDKPCIEFVK